MKILVTGSCGLIGSEAARRFAELGHEVVGLDNNMRREFFGEAGDTLWMRERLISGLPGYRHCDLDIRDRGAIDELFRAESFNAVLHCAAQPSHDRAADFPLIDFDVNAVGTLNLLEANRQHSVDSPFVFMSTNKVFGDGPNRVALVEREVRYDFADQAMENGIAESFPIDATTHSVFGASKVAADVMVQEYGRYFGMPTCCLRGGCLTGPGHSGVALHGFLSYLVKSHVDRVSYTVLGYKGKQVRDNIHSQDVVSFVEAFIDSPRAGAVYNIGGGRENSLSILEAFSLLEKLTDQPANWRYDDQNRVGDHICYYSDLRHIRNDYPNWSVTIGLHETFEQLIEGWAQRIHRARS